MLFKGVEGFLFRDAVFLSLEITFKYFFRDIKEGV